MYLIEVRRIVKHAGTPPRLAAVLALLCEGVGPTSKF